MPLPLNEKVVSAGALVAYAGFDGQMRYGVGGMFCSFSCCGRYDLEFA